MKTRRIFGIISSFILALAGIYGILPENGAIKKFLNCFINEFSYIDTIICCIVIVFGLLTIIALIYDLIKEGKRHELKYQSKKFFKFFSNWYSKEGILTLICEDIDWTTSNNDNRIYQELIKKAINKELNLIIKRSNNQLVSNLKEHGANVYEAPVSLVGNFSFSSLSRMSNNSIIIARKKSEDKDDKVIFRDINNIYVTELLNSLIDTLK